MEERKIHSCKSRKYHDVIISMLEQKKPYHIIAKKVGLCTTSISNIAKENNLRYKVVRADLKRNDKIKALISKNVKYEVIADKFNVSKQRVYQFAKEMGFSKWENTRSYYKDTVNNINLDTNKGLTFKEIQKKYNITEKNLKRLYANGLNSLSNFFIEKRNKIIVSEFINGKTAIEITKSKDRLLQDYNKISNVNMIYRITTRAGIRRQPKVGNRSAGGIFEKTETLNLIKSYREQYDYSFEKISETLNEKKIKTISGKTFSPQNVFSKYKKIQNY